jgi:hypothetical protein
MDKAKQSGARHKTKVQAIKNQNRYWQKKTRLDCCECVKMRSQYSHMTRHKNQFLQKVTVKHLSEIASRWTIELALSHYAQSQVNATLQRALYVNAQSVTTGRETCLKGSKRRPIHWYAKSRYAGRYARGTHVVRSTENSKKVAYRKPSKKDIIESNAEAIKLIRLSYRKDIQRTRAYPCTCWPSWSGRHGRIEHQTTGRAR